MHFLFLFQGADCWPSAPLPRGTFILEPGVKALAWLEHALLGAEPGRGAQCLCFPLFSALADCEHLLAFSPPLGHSGYHVHPDAAPVPAAPSAGPSLRPGQRDRNQGRGGRLTSWLVPWVQGRKSRVHPGVSGRIRCFC